METGYGCKVAFAPVTWYIVQRSTTNLSDLINASFRLLYWNT